jgi:hypothetical protein
MAPYTLGLSTIHRSVSQIPANMPQDSAKSGNPPVYLGDLERPDDILGTNR